MWETIWEWVARNRELITWIGGGVSTLASAAWIVFTCFFKDSTAMRAHPTPIEREFPERNYRDRRKLFCEEIRDYLDRLDSKTNLSHRLCCINGGCIESAALCSAD